MARLFYGDIIFVDLFDQNQRRETQKKKKTLKQKKTARPHPAKRRKFRSKSVNHRGKTHKKDTKTINKK